MRRECSGANDPGKSVTADAHTVKQQRRTEDVDYENVEDTDNSSLTSLASSATSQGGGLGTDHKKSLPLSGRRGAALFKLKGLLFCLVVIALLFCVVVIALQVYLLPLAAADLPPGAKQRCPETSPLLVGPLVVDLGSSVSLEQTARDNPELEPGGRYQPKDCVALQKVAVIIPFRAREEHLQQWLRFLHPVLQRQQRSYGVYVVHQHGDGTFNRAKLLNAGYAEALKDMDYDCFVFSDVDLIPLDDHNIYGCFGQPRHLAVAVEKLNFDLPYPEYMGGVCSVSKVDFVTVNGFSNGFFGWGAEDDDFYKRLVIKGMHVSRPSREVGKYRNIPHGKDKGNPDNWKHNWGLLAHTRLRMATDGLSSLSYKLVNTTREPLYTNVTVDIGTWP